VTGSDADQHLVVARHAVEHEVAIGRHGVEAGLDRVLPEGGAGEGATHELEHAPAVVLVDRVAPAVGGRDVSARVLGDLHGRLAEDREAVVARLVAPDPDGEPVGREGGRVGRLEVEDLLTRDVQRERVVQVREHAVRPRPRADDEVGGTERPSGGRTVTSPSRASIASMPPVRSSRVAPCVRARRWWAAFARAAAAMPESAW
jgi:hypothetical protein